MDLKVVIAAKVRPQVREAVRFVAADEGLTVSRFLAELTEREVRQRLLAHEVDRPCSDEGETR